MLQRGDFTLGIAGPGVAGAIIVGKKGTTSGLVPAPERRSEVRQKTIIWRAEHFIITDRTDAAGILFLRIGRAVYSDFIQLTAFPCRPGSQARSATNLLAPAW